MVGISADGARARPRLAIERFWNLPNTITLARIGAGPLLLLLLAAHGPAASRIAGIAFLALSLTDLLDGYLARRGGEVTRIGKLLDPLADKLLVAVALMTLIALARIPMWAVPLATVILLREIAVTSLRAMASAEGVIVAASSLAKWKTGFQIAALTALLLHYPFLGLPAHGLGLGLLVIATGLTLWSGYDYFATYLGRRPGPEV